MNKTPTSAIVTMTAILTLLSVLSVSAAFAQTPFNGGDGSQTNPYLIATAADLATLAAVVNDPVTNIAFADKHYKLIANIDLSEYDNWTPIGTGIIRASTDARDHQDYQNIHLTFRGVFDGAGKTVANLSITSANNAADGFQGYGLFGVVENGTIKNIVLDNVNIDIEAGRVGSVAGAAVVSSIIRNCYVSGNINGGGSVGGVAGHADDNSTIDGCQVVGNVSGTDRVGGVVGHLYNGAVIGCRAAGRVKKDGVEIGGTVGHVWNSVVTDGEIFDAQYRNDETHDDLSRAMIDGDNINVNNNNESTVRITVGPNPADRQSGIVNFYITGMTVRNGRLKIYNSDGNIVNRINITENFAAWDLRDARGRVVGEGTYVIRGTIRSTNVRRERVSAIVGVR